MERQVRAERFRTRLAEVERVRRRRRRHQLVSWIGGATGVVGVAVLVGAVVAGTRGVLLGLGGCVLALLGLPALRAVARRRGASAWDWTTQSHRLIGDPSQRARDPKDRPQGRLDDLGWETWRDPRRRGGAGSRRP